jgi:flagellum-specific peptidoglycan hydrolase FlgJ/LysM repeat protein
MLILTTQFFMSCSLKKGQTTASTKGKKDIPTAYGTTAAPKPMTNLEARMSYIDRFKAVAVREMERTGIPASIKLAQGILESNAGRSELSSKYNNHFGIKCHSDWQGERYYQEDDDKDPLTGQLIKSCFRVYKDPMESFIAHSEFLRDPRKVNRYGTLFQLPKTDYVAWAEGLEKAGYATATDYSEKLIRIIEDMRLAQYDGYSPNELPIGGGNTGVTSGGGSNRPTDDFPVSDIGSNVNKPANTNNNGNNWNNGWINQGTQTGGTNTNPTRQFDAEGVRNDVRYARAYGGMTAYEFAGKYGVRIGDLQAYNEELTELRTALPEGTVLYLQQKRNAWKGENKVHVVKQCETMYDIAQKYGIKLSKLYTKNEMREGEQPQVGTPLLLRRGWFEGAEKPALRDTFGEWRRCKMPETPANPQTGSTPTAGTNPNPVNPNRPTNSNGGIEWDITPSGTPSNTNAGNNTPQYLPPVTQPNNPSSGSSTYYEPFPSYPSTGNPSRPTTSNQPTTSDIYSPTIETPSFENRPSTTPTRPSTQPNTPAKPAAGQFHTVAQGETLWAISRKYGITVDRLKQLNNLPDNIIKPGQALRVK